MMMMIINYDSTIPNESFRGAQVSDFRPLIVVDITRVIHQLPDKHVCE